MAKRPNAMGRIEGEPKQNKFKALPWAGIGKTLLFVGLIVLGVIGTLQFQKTINDIKEQGASEYRLNNCENYTSEDKKHTWLECDAKVING